MTRGWRIALRRTCWRLPARLPPGRLAEPSRRLRTRCAAPLPPRCRRGLFIRPAASFLFRRPGRELRPLRHQRLVAASPLLRARLGNLLLLVRRVRLRLPARRGALARLRLFAGHNLEVRVAVAAAVTAGAFALALVARARRAWVSRGARGGAPSLFSSSPARRLLARGLARRAPRPRRPPRYRLGDARGRRRGHRR